jgi:predicted transcriptional regulator
MTALIIQHIARKGMQGREIGAHNYPIVKTWFIAHPCATNREAAKALGLSVHAVGRHVKRIRAEWGGE